VERGKKDRQAFRERRMTNTRRACSGRAPSEGKPNRRGGKKGKEKAGWRQKESKAGGFLDFPLKGAKRGYL